jgi:uncharacterized membrane protein
VAITVVILFIVHTNTPQYALSVDPSSDMQMVVGSTIRLYVTNTGSSPLTNIKADYGTISDSLPILNPGEKAMLSPSASAKSVTATDDQRIMITKDLGSS